MAGRLLASRCRLRPRLLQAGAVGDICAVEACLRLESQNVRLERVAAQPALLPSLLALRRWFAALPDHTVLRMPALSPTMSQGNVSSWQKAEGDELAAGDVLAEIETDKATLEWENQDDGFLAKILVAAGSKDIAVGTPLAVVVDDSSKIGEFKDFTAEGAGAEEAGPSSSRAGQEQQQQQQPESGGSAPGRKPDGLRRLGPAARRLLAEAGLSEEQVRGTGPLGIVTKGDVLAAARSGGRPAEAPEAKEQAQPRKETPPPPPSPSQQQQPKQQAPQQQAQPGGHRDVPNSQIRKIIAQRLLESKVGVPHFYARREADLEAAQQLRATLKAQGSKVSLNDFVVRAVALALAEVPEANAAWDEAAGEAVRQASVDVAVAVATERGLITPIVRGADAKSLTQVSAEVRELAGRARANKLKPEEFQGGSFTISNLGMFGTDHFCAIINPPQAGILAVGGTQQVVSLVDGQPVARPQMLLTLSGDQRVFDAETTARFLGAVAANLANPVKLLV